MDRTRYEKRGEKLFEEDLDGESGGGKKERKAKARLEGQSGKRHEGHWCSRESVERPSAMEEIVSSG